MTESGGPDTARATLATRPDLERRRALGSGRSLNRGGVGCLEWSPGKACKGQSKGLAIQRGLRVVASGMDHLGLREMESVS